MTEPTVGMFTLDQKTRTLRGYLLPWGVKSKGTSSSNTKPIVFPRDSVRVPRDPMVVSLNDEHERHRVIGRATMLAPDEVGILAEFALADDDGADEWMAEHLDAPVYLSAEVADMTRAPGDTGAGRLAGAAVTGAPAFDGTAVALFSLIGDERPADEPDDDDDDLEDTEPAPAESDPEPTTEPDDTSKEDAVPEATVQNPSQFSRRTKSEAPALTKAGFFAALNHAKTTGDRTALLPYAQEAAETGLFALANIKYDGTGGLVTDAQMPGSWLGELWQGRRFQRKIVPLLTRGTLTSLSATGWVWGVKPQMAAWAGNKTAVPTNTPTVEPKQFPAVRFAGGHDLAIEYYHFGQTDVINSYADAMVDSYAELSDSYALTQLTAGATVFTPDAGNTVNTGLLDIVDGALAVVAGGGTPSWAIVAPDVFKNIIAIPHEDALEYFNATLGLEGGTSNQGFAIVPEARLAAGGIIVGDKGGATAWELPGVPIRVEAPDLVLGGIDNAFFGYIGVGVTNPNVVVKNTEAGLVAGVEESVTVAAAASKK